MVITRFAGGLGNQMFQYAAGRSLGVRMGADFLADVSAYDACKMHNGFELERIFACMIRRASKEDVRGLLGWQRHDLARRILRHTLAVPFRKRDFIVEPHFQYWPGLHATSGSCYLMGDWQSERYFDDISGLVREEFTFRLPIGSENEVVLEQIARAESVAVHVRRGDYVTNPKTLAYHGNCSPVYYESAIEHFRRHYENLRFFVFSDDMAWVRKHIDFGRGVVFVEHNKGNNSYKDMQLMSLCRHQIIANSSFSWWGAWLNGYAGKQVVAPKKWFAASIDDRDLLPLSWLRI